jgi:signal transduction histidine kinase
VCPGRSRGWRGRAENSRDWGALFPATVCGIVGVPVAKHMEDNHTHSIPKAWRAPFGWVLLAISLGSIAASAARYAVIRSGEGRLPLDLETVLFLLGVSAAAACCAFLFTRPRWYAIAMCFRIAAFLLLVACVTECFEIEFLLLGGVALEIAIYEGFPRNLFGCLLVLFGAAAVRMAVFHWGMQIPLSLVPRGLGSFLCMGLLLTVPASLFTKYREGIVSVQGEKRRLDAMVIELADMNMRYQSSATSAKEDGVRNERLRITREIHDVVGYTLTNNIAMMEAATDIMRTNPLGVPGLINAARDNAREGLAQIRGALYELRSHEERDPVGLRAIMRLCRLYEKATRIEVRFSYGNARWEYEASVDSALYHLIQESLMNAFRHGKARHATVALWEADGVVAVSVTDDGHGAENVQEGIGLRGIRERVEAAGGELSVRGRPGFFNVAARMPLGEAPRAR